jgi:hypothetical protein
MGGFDFGDCSFELARIETDNCSTTTGELNVVFYPSDAFLRFVATFCASDFDL